MKTKFSEKKNRVVPVAVPWPGSILMGAPLKVTIRIHFSVYKMNQFKHFKFYGVDTFYTFLHLHYI